MLDEADMDRFFDEHFSRRAFRLEVRDRYAVASDGGDFARYQAGEPLPDAARKNAWLDELRRDTAVGKTWQWVHVVRAPLSPYLRYQFEWGYAINVTAGAQIRVLDLAERDCPAVVPGEDFWLLDDQVGLRMHYDAEGQFLGADELGRRELPRYRAAQDAAWAAAQPFAEYWAAHPGFHRSRVA